MPRDLSTRQAVAYLHCSRIRLVQAREQGKIQADGSYRTAWMYCREELDMLRKVWDAEAVERKRPTKEGLIQVFLAWRGSGKAPTPRRIAGLILWYRSTYKFLDPARPCAPKIWRLAHELIERCRC